MSYVLGSATESVAFSGSGIEYSPTGQAHAVDTQSLNRSPDSLLAYAICGAPIRWAERPFDPAATNVHDPCARLALGKLAR